MNGKYRNLAKKVNTFLTRTMIYEFDSHDVLKTYISLTSGPNITCSDNGIQGTFKSTILLSKGLPCSWSHLCRFGGGLLPPLVAML